MFAFDKLKWFGAFLYYIPSFLFFFSSSVVFSLQWFSLLALIPWPRTQSNPGWCLLHHSSSVRVTPLQWSHTEIIIWHLASENEQDFINTSTTGRKNGSLWWTKGRKEERSPPVMFRQAGQTTYQRLKGMNHPAAEQPSKTLNAKRPVKWSEQEPHVTQSRLGHRCMAWAGSNASAEWFRLTGGML